MNEVYAHAPRVVFRSLKEGEGGVLLHMRTGQYHGVNETGAYLWEKLDGSRTLDNIAADVTKDFTNPPEGLETLIQDFFSDLAERELVVSESTVDA
ncbi:MAG: PqqD family peptide modification chaperone [Actinobacteria bacterium]|nr:PqqD family peptide modification chaperone [Actinomycetota bacterium]